MTKKLFVFVLVIQAIISFLHWLLYKILLAYFPALYTHNTGILIACMVVSISFLGMTFADHVSENFLVTWGYILSSALLALAFYFLVISIPLLLIFALSSIAGQILGTIAVAGSGLITIYGLINARIIRVVELKVKLPNLPEIWKHRSAIMASDLHFGHILNMGTAKKVAAKIRSLKADIVFIPGDFYDGGHTDFRSLANEFSGKSIAPLGVYFSSGNHELFAGYNLCEDAIKNAGIKILEDQKVEIDGLQIIGLAYHGDSLSGQPETHESVKQKLSTIGVDRVRPSIVLKHVPNHMEAIEEMGGSLQLSGHSHQGQTWPGPLVTKRVWKGFDYGFKKLRNLQVYVSSGVGTWGPPVRFMTQSEIIRITFE